MGRTELAARIAARTGVALADVQAVLDALVELGRASGMNEDDGTNESAESSPDADELVFLDLDAAPPVTMVTAPPATGAPHSPSAREITNLIDDARRHPLGLDFLLNGDIGAVAITFRTQAFAVDAARQYLRDHAPDTDPRRMP